MSQVATTYNRYSFLTEEQRSTGLSALERYRAKQAETDQAKTAATDDVALSAKGKELAAASGLSREDMEALSYAHLLEFETENGEKVRVDLAMNPDSEEEYLAARITVTRPDGTEEVLYVPFTERAEENAEETATETAAEEEEADDAVKAATAEAAEEAQPTLMELIEKYGFNKIADASEGLFAAIRARIEAMIEASEETAEKEEALAKVKDEREARNQASEGTGAAAAAAGTGSASGSGSNAGIGEEINAVSGKMARTLAKYANSGNSFSMGSFSKRY